MNTHLVRRPLAVLIISTFATGAAPAADFTFLTNPLLEGWVTSDAYLGNADDTYYSGINTIGAASQFSASSGTYGFLGGDMMTQGLSVFGLQDQQYFGANQFTAVNMFAEWNLNAYALFNQPFTQSLNTGAPSVITINPDQSYTTSFVLDDTGTGGRIQIDGVGHYLLRWQIPVVSNLYSGDLLTHFDFVTPLLPFDGWLSVAQESQTWTVLDGPQAGVTGFTTATFYTNDYLGIPAEPLVALGAPWVTTGYAADFQVAVRIGQTNGENGTASLLAGDIASIKSLEIAHATSSAVTVDGIGTQLSVSFPLFGPGIVVGDGSSFSVTGGAQVDIDGNGSIGNFASVTGTGLGAQLLIDGTGSELRVHGASGPLLEGTIAGSTINNYVAFFAGATGAIGNGAKVVAEGHNTSGILIGGIGGPISSVVIDGAGSTLESGGAIVIGTNPDFNSLWCGGGCDSGPGELVVRNGAVAQAATIYIGADGSVTGTGGTLQGSVINHGTLLPGESPGVLNIVGDFEQSANGTLVIEIGGTDPGMFDVLNISGTATLAGTLIINLINGFMPDESDVFDFLLAGAFAGGFNTFILPTFGNGQTLHVSGGPLGFSATVVPLPTAFWLVTAALAALAANPRRTRDMTAERISPV